MAVVLVGRGVGRWWEIAPPMGLLCIEDNAAVFGLGWVAVVLVGRGVGRWWEIAPLRGLLCVEDNAAVFGLG